MDSRTLHESSLHENQVVLAERQKLESGQRPHAMEYLDYHMTIARRRSFRLQDRLKFENIQNEGPVTGHATEAAGH